MVPGFDVEPLALFWLLAVNQELADRCRPMASGLLSKGLLPARDREIVISRTTARAGAEYEWGVHRTVFDEHTSLLVAAADELHDFATISEQTWTGLRSSYDDRQQIELLLLAGWYRTLSMVVNAVQLPLEPWASRFP
jgi:4-carboxymuconolactone decarboxylase